MVIVRSQHARLKSLGGTRLKSAESRVVIRSCRVRQERSAFRSTDFCDFARIGSKSRLPSSLPQVEAVSQSSTSVLLIQYRRSSTVRAITSYVVCKVFMDCCSLSGNPDQLNHSNESNARHAEPRSRRTRSPVNDAFNWRCNCPRRANK